MQPASRPLPRSNSGTPGRRRNRIKIAPASIPPTCAHHALVGRRHAAIMMNCVTTQTPSTQAGRDAQRDEPERQHPHPHARMQDQIGGDHARRRRRWRRSAAACEAGSIHACARPPATPHSEIEDEKLEMPHGVLDVVAEHPQEQHVGEQVQDVAVQEHVGDQRRAFGHWWKLIVAPAPAPPDTDAGNSSEGMSAKLARSPLARQPQVCEHEDDHVGGDQADRDPLEADRRRGLSSDRGMKTTARYPSRLRSER